MCTNGINVNQVESMIDQIDDHVALEYRWIHKVGHIAEDAGLPSVSEKLHTAQSLLADVRSILDEAGAVLSDDVNASTDISAKLV